jgi:transcriptional regulator with XRE-family HTH domain
MPFVALTTGGKVEEHIRKRFRQWFEESKQTQKEAGAAIEWEQQTVSSYFNGSQQIDFVRAIAWCKHFGYEVSDLLSDSPRTKPENPRLQKLINKWSGMNKHEQDWILNAPTGGNKRAR